MNSLYKIRGINVRASLMLVVLMFVLAPLKSEAQCLGAESISFSPMPTGGAYAPGTTVTICYNLSSYTLSTFSWLDGFQVTLGTGWSNIQPALAPTTCGTAAGVWIWQTSLLATGSGQSFGNGYYYDYDNDGDGGNDFGDNGTCAFSFCITATVVSNSDLTVGVTAGGDGTMGSYTGSDCPLILFQSSPLSDSDFDGFIAANDCNDFDATIFPGATEICDGIDQDCDGAVDNGFDMDGDGMTTCQGDCNDNDPAIFPGAVCNDGDANTGGDAIQVDCSCLGVVTAVGDEPFLPFTADPLTGCVNISVDPTLFTPTTIVTPPGCGANTAAAPKPDAWFVVNVPASGVLYLNPQDASGTIDAAMAAYTYDAGTNTYTMLQCNDDGMVGTNLYMPVITVNQPAGTPIYVQLWAYGGGLITFDFCSSDCTTPTVYYADTDGDGFGNPSAVVYACAVAPGVVLDNTDCNDACPSCFVGGTEACDGLDNNCDGLIDNGCVSVDNDNDGFDSSVDCDDNNAAINPSANEICDYLDNNCNVEIDEFTQLNFYADMDGDGFGDINNVVFDCVAPAGYVADFSDCDDMMITYQDNDGDGFGSNLMDPCGIATNGDCNDNTSAAFPGNAEVCADFIDNNCDGAIDEGCAAGDADGDGFDSTVDCNDNCATVYPGAVCDDNNASTVGETIQPDCTCGGGTVITNCLGSESITFSPAPVGGTWPIGTSVDVCYTLNYTQASGDWLDGMAVTLGTGWGTPTGTIAPANCSAFGTGAWIWQTSNIPTSTNGVQSGYGWYYDYTIDGNGGNDYGDMGSCTFSMCFNATTVADVDLWVAVASGGDSYYGSYSSTAGCPLVPFTVDPINVPSGCEMSFPYCATPSACDPLTNIYSLTSANSNLIQMYNAPTTGTLDISLDGVVSQTITAPFAGSVALNIGNLDSDGTSHILTATFSDAPGCSATTTFIAPVACSDADGDGFGFAADCNDNDPNIYPGAPEVCGNSIDDNCDNVIDEGCGTDVDGDGYDTTVDCNDNDAAINPGASETCGDATDNNCNGCIDEGCGSGGDEPCNAFTADPTTGCIAVTIDPALYTPSINPGPAGCANNTATAPKADAWILLNVPASGTLFLNPQGTVDAGMAAYTFDAVTGTYTQIGCDDDTGPGLMPQLTLTLTAGTPVYVQIWAFGGGLIDFSFCSSDCTTPTAYYPDLDLDTFGDANTGAIYTCTPDPTWVANNTDCDDTNPAIAGGLLEVCGDGLDNNCDTQIDEGCTTDVDGDGFVTANDCDDNNPAVFPGAIEICNVIDDNCDGVIDEGFDLDGDGYTSCNGDCNDNDPTLYVGAVCDDGNPLTVGDQIDANCACGGMMGDEPTTAFTVDPLTGCIDVTVDPSSYTPSNPPGPAGCANNTAANPKPDVWMMINVPSSGTLLLNPQGTVDAGMAAYTYDAVLGTYTQVGCDDDSGPGLMPQLTITTVPAGTSVYIQLWSYGGGLINFSFCSSDCATPTAYYADADLDGYGDPASSVIYTCTQPAGLVGNNTDCNDADITINPGVLEVCSDGIDQNCDGVIDGGCNTDTDGDGTVDALDCAPNNAAIYPGATEICNTLDEDCDGVADNGLPTTTYFADMDADGFGSLDSVQLCYDPANPPVCLYTFNLTDAFGDGWNGGYIDLMDNANGTIMQSIGSGFTTGSTFSETSVLLNNMTYSLVWTSGGFFSTEIGMDVLDPTATIVYNLPAGSTGLVGTTLYDISVTCPAETFYITVSGDCDDANVAVNPNATEVCDLMDNNCDSNVDEGFDVDADGYTVCGGDCDDNNALVNPGMMEDCTNGIDDNCNFFVDENIDLDFDGVTTCSGDCNDNDATIFPGATEVCDGVDNNCDGITDEGFDVDGDGFTTCSGDCDDNNAAVNPGIVEVCNNIDDNCDGQIDEFVLLTFYADLDGDGFGNINDVQFGCSAPVGYVTDNTDCDDTMITYADVDADGFGSSTTFDACGIMDNTDCDDSNPAVNTVSTEVCNGIDDNCDGVTDEGCGTAGCTNFAACNFDPAATIDDGSCVLPSPEVCDGIDNDCDGTVDDGVLNTYYADVDGDGLGSLNNSISTCILIPGFVANSNDCDDSDATLLGPGSACDNGSTLDTLDTFQADCSCQGLLFGCTDLVACNYDENATYDDGSCTYSSLQLASITGDTLVLPFTQAHQYSYPDTIPGLSFQWSLNPLGVFIPNSSIDTTSVITVFWSNATSTIPDGIITLVVTDENCGPNASFTLTYIVHFDTTDYSVDESEQALLHVWPNPTQGSLNIEVPKEVSGSYNVVITDMIGQIVHQDNEQTDRIWKHDLNLSSGLYMVRLLAEDKLYSIPIIID